MLEPRNGRSLVHNLRCSVGLLGVGEYDRTLPRVDPDLPSEGFISSDGFSAEVKPWSNIRRKTLFLIQNRPNFDPSLAQFQIVVCYKLFAVFFELCSTCKVLTKRRSRSPCCFLHFFATTARRRTESASIYFNEPAPFRRRQIDIGFHAGSAARVHRKCRDAHVTDVTPPVRRLRYRISRIPRIMGRRSADEPQRSGRPNLRFTISSQRKCGIYGNELTMMTPSSLKLMPVGCPRGCPHPEQKFDRLRNTESNFCLLMYSTSN